MTVSVADKDLAKQALQTYDLPKGQVYRMFQRNVTTQLLFICGLIVFFLGDGKATLFSATDKDWHKNRVNISLYQRQNVNKFIIEKNRFTCILHQVP